MSLDTLALCDASVLGNMLYVRNSAGDLVPESFRRDLRDRKAKADDPEVLADCISCRVHKLPGTWVLGSASSGNYFHWLTESLASYLWACRMLGPDVGLLIPRKAATAPFVTETATWTPAAGIRWVRREVLQCERLIMPGIARKRIAQYSKAIDEVFEPLRQKLSGPGPFTGERIYLPRTGFDRELANEQEIASALTSKGFWPVDPAAYSVADQARIFANAKTIVAPHGAALTNLIFAKPGTRVIELQTPERHGNLCFSAISTVRGHRHTVVRLNNDAANIDMTLKLIACSGAETNK